MAMEIEGIEVHLVFITIPHVRTLSCCWTAFLQCSGDKRNRKEKEMRRNEMR
jgi:hypothetical protein